MKPSQLAKYAGLKSLKEMAKKTGYSKAGLIKMFHNDRPKFEALLEKVKHNIITCATCGRRLGE